MAFSLKNISLPDISLSSMSTKVTTLLTAHVGCMAAPIVSMATTGQAAPQSSLMGAVTMAVGGALVADHMIRRYLPCPYCIETPHSIRMQQASVAIQAVGLGIGMHLFNGWKDGGHEHHASAAAQHQHGVAVATPMGTVRHEIDANGREITILTSEICSSKGNKTVVDTVFASRTIPKPLEHKHD